MKSFRQALLIGLSSAALLWPALASAQASNPASAMKPVGADASDIIVTAQRRAERAQDVPVAMTVLNQSQLTMQQITQIQQLTSVVPNATNFYSRGDPTTLLLSLRGIPTGAPLVLQDPSVGVYVDGVYHARTQGEGLGLVDMERVEVLRGPQGTLFGRNTIGGALNLTTNKPTNKLEGELTGGIGNYGERQLQAILNVPVVSDVLAIRLVYSHQQHNGYVRDVTLGQDMNDLNAEYVRASVRLTPRGGWTVDLSGDFAANDTKSQSLEPTYISPSSPINFLPLFNGNPTDSVQKYIDHNYRTNYSPYNPDLHTRNRGASLNIAKEAGNVTLRSITGFRYVRALGAGENAGLPYFTAAAYSNGPAFNRQFSQELQINGDAFGKRLQWIGGLYYFREHGLDVTELNVLRGIPGIGSALSVTRSLATNKSVGAFAQATFALTDQVRLTGGVRYTSDTREITRAAYAQDVFTGMRLACTLDPATITHPATCSSDPEQVKAHFVPFTVGVDYKPAPALLLYAKFSRGFRSGGFPSPAGGTAASYAPFGPEKLSMTEVGLKSDLIDRHLQFNIAGYYSNYSNIQQSVTQPGLAGQPPYVQVGNFGNARIFGFEASLNAHVSDFRLVANVGALSAKYTAGPYKDGQPATALGAGVIADTPYQLTPKFTASVNAGYGHQIADIGRFDVHVDYSYQSRIYYAPLSVADPASHSFESIGGYGLLGAGASLKLDNPDVTISVWGRNLTNKQYLSSLVDFVGAGFGAVTGFVGDPRTYGGTVAVRF